ncbi:hypothetical protein ACFQ0B_51435 [Nonomuraea thailandensis]
MAHPHGPWRPEVSGIDPARMDGFAAALDRAGVDVAEQTQAIRAELTRLGVGTLTLTPFVEIERWVRGQVPKLRARNGVIRRRVPGWTPGIVTYDEATMPYASPPESRREGAAMGELYLRHLRAAEHGMSSPLPNDAPHRFRELLERVLAHQDDPDFAAAFFGHLGTTRTLALPQDILALFGPAATGLRPGPPERRLLGGFSRLLAAATTASPRSPLPFGHERPRAGRGGRRLRVAVLARQRGRLPDPVAHRGGPAPSAGLGAGGRRRADPLRAVA